MHHITWAGLVGFAAGLALGWTYKTKHKEDR